MSVLMIFFVSVICIILGLLFYRVTLEKNLTDASNDSLDGLVEQQIFAFYTQLNNQRRTIKNYANLFSLTDLSDAQTANLLADIAENSSFDYISLAALDGTTIEGSGDRLDVSDKEYFIRALAGETFISNPEVSEESGRSVVSFSTPVTRYGVTEAVLIGNYDAERLSALIMPTFNGDGYTYITTDEGEIIAKTENDSSLSNNKNLFETLKTVKHHSSEMFPVLSAASNSTTSQDEPGASGWIYYAIDGENQFMKYAPIGINDWYVFSVAPECVVAPQMASTMRSTTLLMFSVCIIFIAILIYFFYDKKKHFKELYRFAYIDSLTDSANRRKFKADAAALLLKNAGTYAFVYLDIDKFKVLNDTLGFASGDKVLINIANTLKTSLNDHETFGRGESDQYFLLMQFISDDAIRARLEKIIDVIKMQFSEQIDSGYSLVLCIGVYVINDINEPISVMNDRAKHAHQLVKGSQISSIAFYSEEIRERILCEKRIENKMHDALLHEEFMLFLQPKYRLDNEKICGAEALVRWDNGSDSIVYPDEFIPLFEKNGFITKLDLYMLEKACAVIRKWLDTGVTPIPISINFSRAHLQNPHFVADIAAVVQRHKIPPQLIEVELTESTMLDNEDVLIGVLNDLHHYGFTLSMDDFGSGYSSLGLLKNLSVDTVKLDKTFFTCYINLSRAKIVISNMIIMTKELGIFTVAEGVETQENIDLLRELGCDIVQGYYFAKPMPAEDFDKLVRGIAIEYGNK